jgi:hypothetical protein
VGVEEPGEDPVVDLSVILVGGDDRRQALVVAVVEELRIALKRSS